MKKLLGRKSVFLSLLILALCFANMGAFAQESGGTSGYITYEQYLATNPADTSYEAFMRWTPGGRSRDLIDCRRVCSDACASTRTRYQYWIRDTCWW